jgi:hypothetical protein
LLNRYDKYGTGFNSHDILKLIAISATVCGHTGYFFIPDEPMLRVYGRLSMPIFLFLVGYSTNYKFSKTLLNWGIGLSLVRIACSPLPLNEMWQEAFPLNILFSVMFARMWLGWIENKNYLPQYMFTMCFLLCCAWVPAKLVMDYGTAAFMFSLAGWIARNGAKNFENTLTFITIFAFHGYTQLQLFEFDPTQKVIFAAEMALLAWLFFNFKMKKRAKKEGPAAFYTIPLLFIARNSMVIYALHVAAFTIIARIYAERLSDLPISIEAVSSVML